MLIPAIVKKSQLDEAFAKEIYTKNYFYYYGYPLGNTPPEIKPEENVYQWASVDEKGNLLGYIAYRIDTLTNSACNFGLYSFDKGNLTVIKDLYHKMEDLIERYHRIEWRVIDGNHAKRGYINFCEKHNGNIVHLHDVTKDPDGNYVDEYIFEIINLDN